VDVPDVSYAQSGDVSIAYQAVGEGPPDLVFLPFMANIYMQQRIPDTVLTTVLFTDLVGSTERGVELGDRAWRELLEKHNVAVRHEPGRRLYAVRDA
jgi:class 3 adenylate cyclase